MITENEKRVYEILNSLNIQYKRYAHDPIYTVEEAKKIDEMIPGKKCKNLFLKSAKENTYYLYILDEDKRADLKSLSKKIESSRLSFGSEEELYDCLKLTRGSVTPFGIINDTHNKVVILFDEELKGEGIVNFHPNVNTATIGISQNDLERFIKFEQNEYYYV